MRGSSVWCILEVLGDVGILVFTPRIFLGIGGIVLYVSNHLVTLLGKTAIQVSKEPKKRGAPGGGGWPFARGLGYPAGNPTVMPPASM